LPGTQVFCEDVEFCGKTCKLVLTYSESFFSEQLNGITNDIVKCERELKEYYISLQKWRDGKFVGKAPKYSDAEKKVKTILSKQFMSDLFTVEIDKTQHIPQITYSFNRKQHEFLLKHRLGRNALITDHLKWAPEEVVNTYRSLYNIEDVFKRMKNIDYLHWQPAYHWTDQKIKVHGLYCVIALLLVSLARKISCEAGIDLSFIKLLDELSAIREVATIYPEGNDKNVFTMSRMSPKQKQLSILFEIGEVLQG
jgi:transposase